MDIGSLHPDEISPLDSLQQILVSSVGQLHKTREIWGPHLETLVKRAREKARNEALACMTSLEEVSEKSLFEIAMLRAVLAGGIEGIAFDKVFKPALRYIESVAPSLLRGTMTEGRLKRIYGLFVAACEQLLADKRIAKYGGKLHPTNEAAPWFDKWRTKSLASGFSEEPNENEKRFFARVDALIRQPQSSFRDNAMVSHKEYGKGRIRKILDDMHILVRFRFGNSEYYCPRESLTLVEE